MHTALMLLATLVVSKPPVSIPISYACRQISKTWVHVVTVDLRSERVKVSGVVSQYRGRAESVRGMVARAQPTVAITGTFHGGYPKLPVGDIVIDGNVAASGRQPCFMVVDWYNRAQIISPHKSKPMHWYDYEYVLGGGLPVVRNGVAQPDPAYHKDRGLFRPAARTAAGITKDNRLILVVTRQKVTLSRLGAVLKVLGAKDAISLDGGSSTCLYYRGRMVVPAGRQLTNLLVAWDNLDRYQRVRGVLSGKAIRKK